MTSEEIFNIWAPAEAPWSLWAKPVLFAFAFPTDVIDQPASSVPPQPPWIVKADRPSALVLDLPGPAGVEAGLLAAKHGFRPVPLYNALPSPGGLLSNAPDTVCDVRSILYAICRATPELGQLKLPLNAPPAFLLDSQRRTGHAAPLPGMFDNRSVSLPTDFPSAVRIRESGVNRVVLVQESALEPQADLAHTLLRWQEGGIRIEAATLAASATPAPITIRKPPLYRMMWQRLLATIGFRRNPLGGFGGRLPSPSVG